MWLLSSRLSVNIAWLRVIREVARPIPTLALAPKALLRFGLARIPPDREAREVLSLLQTNAPRRGRGHNRIEPISRTLEGPSILAGQPVYCDAKTNHWFGPQAQTLS
jgi:hypothetical protein